MTKIDSTQNTHIRSMWNEKKTTDKHTEANYNEINVQHVRSEKKKKKQNIEIIELNAS